MPLNPETALGLVYPINVHGTAYYLSAIQVTELGILTYVFCAFFLAGALLTTQAVQFGELLLNSVCILIEGVGPVESFPAKRGRELDRVEEKGSPFYFLFSALTSLIAFWYASAPIASFLVLKGIVLKCW